MKAIRQSGSGAVVALRIQPRASKNEVVGKFGDAIKIRLCAPPVEGKANSALVEFLSDTLDLPRSAISILSGHTGRNKQVMIEGISAEDVKRKLLGAKTRKSI